MKKIKVILVVGARPNFIKAAPLHKELRANKLFSVKLVHTGQHYDKNMSDNFFEELGLPNPDINMGINSGTPTEQIAKIAFEFEKILIKDRPDVVLVFGDVNSTIACSLATNKNGVKLGHVEAGLRSFDREMPEEINRILTDQIADYLFTPSVDGDKNLKKEGVSPEKIFMVGNIMIDTLVGHKKRAAKTGSYEKYELKKGDYVYLTLHRPSNVDIKNNLKSIVDSIDIISKDRKIVFPIHPRTSSRIQEFGLMKKLKNNKNIILIPPASYLENINFQMNAYAVLTDSGGIQEETTYLGVPCLTLRENTERPITVTNGTNRVVGINKKNILKAYAEIKPTHKPKKPKYWDGKTSARIAKILLKYFG